MVKIKGRATFELTGKTKFNSRANQVQPKAKPSPTQVQPTLHQFKLKSKLPSDNHSPTRCQFVTNESALVLVLLGLLAFVGLASLLGFFGFLGLWSGFLIRLIG